VYLISSRYGYGKLTLAYLGFLWFDFFFFSFILHAAIPI
jgi:hypothetical protein